MQSKQVCNKCVLDAEINLDLVNGVCKYCRYAKQQYFNRKLQVNQRPWVVYNIKKAGKGKKYDCLIGLSGGVDSSIALFHLLEQGLRPLAFSVDNGWQTPEAQENIMRLVEGFKVPYFRYTIDIPKFQELQKAFIKSGVKNIEIPTDHILFAATYEVADKYGIKTVISGGNWQTEGTMPEDYGYSARDLTYIKAIAEDYGSTTEGLPTLSLLRYLYLRNIKKIKIVNLLDYYDYNRDNAIKTLQEKVGFKPYGEKHAESTFTKWFQNVYLYHHWHLDKRKPHLTSLIHSEQMTREQALEELKKPVEKVDNPFENMLITTPPKEYPTNQYWDEKWVAFFNLLKKFGYQR